MKKRFLVLSVFVVALFAAGSVLAATATTNLQVSASVAATCRITSVNNIAFGEYDVTSETPKDAQGDMSFKCTKGTTYKTYITGTRSMTNGTDNLSFQLYSDSNRSAVFPTDNSGSGEQAASSSTITKNIYGRIAAGQDVGVGNYSQTLTATVEY